VHVSRVQYSLAGVSDETAVISHLSLLELHGSVPRQRLAIAECLSPDGMQRSVLTEYGASNRR